MLPSRFSYVGFLGYLHTKGVATVISRCVLCRTEMQIPTLLSGCFCGNGLINTKKEEELPDMPHSCGQICGRSRGEFCTHPCTDICHPGQCHPCSATISLHCRCGRTEYVSLYANLSPSLSPLCLDKRFVVEPIPILCSVIWFVVNYLTARNTCVSLFVMQDLAPPVKSLSIASVIVE